jgi:NADPH:quinone reductase
VKAYGAQNNQLIELEVPEPESGPGQMVVAVQAAGLNAADIASMAGTHVQGMSTRPPERDLAEPITLGSEASGTVISVGDGVSKFKPGDRVMSVCGGAFAPKVVMHEAMAMAVPEQMTWAEAAAVPIAFTTAHDALATAGHLLAGENVLVTAASSGVGVAALQLARLLGASTIAGSSRFQAKLDALTANNVPLDLGLLAADPSFSERALDATDAHGFDVIIDTVGSGALTNNVASAALLGRIVSVGRSGGKRDDLNLDELARKQISLIGVTFRSRSPISIFETYQKAAATYLPALADGRLHAVVDRTFPYAELAAAQAWMTKGRSIGKVILEVA